VVKKRNRGPRKPVDPAIQAVYSRRWYEKHKAEQIARVTAQKETYKNDMFAYIFQYLSTHPCVDCGEKDPIVLEFDHRDPTQKLFSISQALRLHYGLGRVCDEIEKCDVRCANCHRRKTSIEGNHRRSRLIGFTVA